MGFKCGIVGLPNVGKSSLFNALTSSEIPAENYPFCTIEPNVGVVPVPNSRLEVLSSLVNPLKTIPSVMEFVDIAGLVQGAAAGEGLGNQFLAHIRETQAIAHVVRCFESSDVTHVRGKIDPIGDIEIIETELMLSDLESCSRSLEKAKKLGKAGDKEHLSRLEVFEFLVGGLSEGIPVREMTLDKTGVALVKESALITAKPVLFVSNLEEGTQENRHSREVAKYSKEHGCEHVEVSAAIEAEISLIEDSERTEFLEELGLAEPGLNRLIRAGYDLLGLHSFFTAGPNECRAWTLAKGSRAPQAAGAIHTDFERGFIRAEVVSFEDYKACGTESAVRERGKLRIEGKDYVVCDGDIMHFRFNV
jgi:GTP-binding protein YchF